MNKIVFFLLISFVGLKSAYSADDFCPMSGSSSSAAIPTSGTFRILIVMCKFQDDNFDLSPYTDVWPSSLNQMPTWGPNLVSTTVQQSYSNPSMSGYFQTMSDDSYDVIGDVVFYQPQNNQSYYFLSSSRHLGYLTEEILTAIDPSVNFAN